VPSGTFDQDVQGLGYVMNASALWAHDPAALDGLSDLLGHVTPAGSLTYRQRAILVTSCASALGDSYCSLAWGSKLAAEAGADVAEGVLCGDDTPLDDSERALARWARQLARDPNTTTAGDVQSLRAAGFDDAQIFAITVFVAVRIAFSTVNDALGAPAGSAGGSLGASGSPRRRHLRPADRRVEAGFIERSVTPAPSRSVWLSQRQAVACFRPPSGTSPRRGRRRRRQTVRSR
jgi:alkylhydroperoxidase family enzyme